MPTSSSPPADERLRERRFHGYETARPDVQALVPLTARNILELGCSNGALGASLKERQGASVVGVEISEEYAASAADRLDRVVVASAEDFLAGARPEEAPFDCLIAADVLEHMVDPWDVLARSVELLAPGATVVISLPNILFGPGLLRVIRRGRWPRDDQGIFDRTHLRWFGREDAIDLLRAAGLEPVDAVPQYGSVGVTLAIKRALGRTPLRRFMPRQYVVSGLVPSR